MNIYSLVVLFLTCIGVILTKESLKVSLVTNLKAGNKEVTKPFLDKFEKDMKKVIMDANLHEDDFGEVERQIINSNGMFSMSYTTEKGLDKCSQAIILTQKAVSDIEKIVNGSIVCGDMPAVTFNKN